MWVLIYTLVPEVFLDFSPLRWENREAAIAASRLSHLKRRKIKKNLWDQGIWSRIKSTITQKY